MTTMKAKMGGIFTPNGLRDYEAKLLKAKKMAYKKSFPEAKRKTKEALVNRSKGVFKVKSKTFGGMFTASLYDRKNNKMPSTLFYTRSNYFKIHEFGGKTSAKKSKGLLIPFVSLNNRGRDKAAGILGAKEKFHKVVEQLRRQGKTFVKKINGKLILFATIDKDNRRSIGKFRKLYAVKNGVKRVMSGTAIPIGIIVKSAVIKRRFDYSNIARTNFITRITAGFDKNIKL